MRPLGWAASTGWRGAASMPTASMTAFAAVPLLPPWSGGE